MLMTVAIAAIACQIGTAADYFPLEPGTRKVYEHHRGENGIPADRCRSRFS